MKKISVIDIFAGPGGLSEGFNAYNEKFDIKLSIEKDPIACKTLLLRKIYRLIKTGKDKKYYVDYISKKINFDDLLKSISVSKSQYQNSVWNYELGSEDNEIVEKKISNVIKKNEAWVLLGGPPCQAYSTVGRSRMLSTQGDDFYKDSRHYLYKEYLKILSKHKPSVFIFENVKGILSSKINGEKIFSQICIDLKNPDSIFDTKSNNNSYSLFSLSKNNVQVDLWKEQKFKPSDFVVKSEDFGIPQKRHRVIIFNT